MAAVNTAWDLEEFLGALTRQLDRVQDSLRVKAMCDRPLTFAVRDLDLDLKVFPAVDTGGNVRFRHAQPNEEGASTIALKLATITRPLIDQSTRPLGLDDDPRSITELEDLPQNARQRLSRMGIETVSDLKRLNAMPTATRELAERAKVTTEDLARLIHGVRRPRIDAVVAAPPKPIPPAPPKPPQQQPPSPAPKPRPRVQLVGSHLEALEHAEVTLGDAPVRVVERTATHAELELDGRPKSGELRVRIPGQPDLRYELPLRGRGKP